MQIAYFGIISLCLTSAGISGCAADPQPTISLAAEVGACNDISSNISANGQCLRLQTYKAENLTSAPTLVVALHGDAPFGKPSYQYRFAELVSEQSENTISVGLLRPGYTDFEERTSDGERGLTVGDNYDAERVSSIADAIELLRVEYNAQKVVLAGHSGGAAISAKLVALHPGLVDHAFIVSCPCDINKWRANMYVTSQYEGFKGDLDVRSPIDLAGDVPVTTKVTIISGTDDEIASPDFSVAYVAALEANGHQPDYRVVQGDHEIFLNEEVISIVSAASLD